MNECLNKTSEKEGGAAHVENSTWLTLSKFSLPAGVTPSCKGTVVTSSHCTWFQCHCTSLWVFLRLLCPISPITGISIWFQVAWGSREVTSGMWGVGRWSFVPQMPTCKNQGREGFGEVKDWFKPLSFALSYININSAWCRPVVLKLVCLSLSPV